MENKSNDNHKILIVNHSEINRGILVDILEDEFDIVEAANGMEAIAILQNHSLEFSLMLLDIDMPGMDGFEVLELMNKYRWIEDVPVIMLAVEESTDDVRRACDLGVTNFMSYPLDASVVSRRVTNTILLNAKQRRLMELVATQIYEKEKSNKLMISILSHIVEFRNGESGLHVQHINIITDMLLKRLVQKTNRYGLTRMDITQISMASALHDIGKISVPDEILNKPGRLTKEEFTMMKSHSLIGAQMLDDLPISQKEESLVKYAYEICRWHHERYDGGGYPDGLSGDRIPISAQVVSLADVYDALTSVRCYKNAFSHEEAIDMIVNGQCGEFNPLLLECLMDISDLLKKEMTSNFLQEYEEQDVDNISQQFQSYDLSSVERQLVHLEYDRQYTKFLSMTSPDVLFRYTVSPALLELNERGRRLFGLDGPMLHPMIDPKIIDAVGNDKMGYLIERLKETTPSQPEVSLDLPIKLRDKTGWYRCICTTIWSSENSDRFIGVAGRLLDVNDEYRIKTESQESVYQTMLRSMTEGSSLYDVHHMTGSEAWLLLQYLQEVCDLARLVDADVNYQVLVDKDGSVRRTTYRCFCTWKRKQKCENCVSAQCLYSKKRLDKFEFVNDEIYHIIATYVEVEGRPYVLELVSKINDDTLLSGYGRENLVAAISNHNTKLYIDPVTGVYNRRYYEEQLSAQRMVEAVAMIDVDDFKQINDCYGHLIGDTALQFIAKTIKEGVRKSDAVIRYGGDEFVVVFRDIPKSIFEQKLEEIRERVRKLEIDECPEVRLSVSVGGVYEKAKVEEVLKKADAYMYQMKRRKKEMMN